MAAISDEYDEFIDRLFMISLSENSSELAVSSSLKDLLLVVELCPPRDVPLRRFPLGEDDPVRVCGNDE